VYYKGKSYITEWKLEPVENIPIWCFLSEETEIDLEYSLEQAHVGTLVQTNLVLPEVDNKDFGRGK
jgi:hypothetical protein